MSNEATLTSKGQTTVPKAIRDSLSMKAGDRMTFTLMPDATVVMRSRRAASYVQRILGGAKPADLPVERPTVYRLSVNRTTAAALGLIIPQSLLLRADEVFQ